MSYSTANMMTIPKPLRIYHNQIEQIIKNSKFNRYYRTFDIACYAYLFIRMLNHLAVFITNGQYEYWKFDYYSAYGIRYPREYNSILAIIITNALLFGLL